MLYSRDIKEQLKSSVEGEKKMNFMDQNQKSIELVSLILPIW